MKRTYLVILLMVISCKNSASLPGSEKQAGSKKTTLLYSGTIFATRSYCGGARPTEEILQEFAKPKPFSNDSLRLTNTITQESFLVKTNEKGMFSVQVSEGNYKLQPAPRTGTVSEDYDPNCDAWKQHVFLVLEVKANESPKQLTILIPCDPCEKHPRP